MASSSRETMHINRSYLKYLGEHDPNHGRRIIFMGSSQEGVYLEKIRIMHRVEVLTARDGWVEKRLLDTSFRIQDNDGLYKAFNEIANPTVTSTRSNPTRRTSTRGNSTERTRSVSPEPPPDIEAAVDLLVAAMARVGVRRVSKDFVGELQGRLNNVHGG